MIGLQNTGIIVKGNNNNGIDIENNIITFNSQRTGEKIVDIEPKNSSQNATNVRFISNTVSGANDNTSPKVKGLLDLPTYIES